MIDPVSSNNLNDSSKNGPTVYNCEDKCTIQNNSCQNLVPLVPCQHESSPKNELEMFSKHQKHTESNNSLREISDEFENSKERSSFPIMPSLNCASIIVDVAHPLDFNLKNPCIGLNDKNENFNIFEPPDQISRNSFKTPCVLDSMYSECQIKTITLPKINLSDEKSLFTKCSRYDCEEPEFVSNSPFQTILPDAIHQKSQPSNKATENFEKTMFLLDKSKESSVRSSSTSRKSAQELGQMQDCLLTNSPLALQETENLDTQKNDVSIFNFDSSASSSINSRSHVSFEDTAECQTHKQYEEDSLLREKRGTSCLKTMIQVHSEDTIQDTSDIYDHIMSNQCANSMRGNKTDVFSNEEHSRDGLANISIEHLNDNSLSNIEINEKLSEDLLNKETNLNLYTTNLTGFMNSDTHFNEEPLPNSRTIIDTCHSLGVNQNDQVNTRFQVAVFQENSMVDSHISSANVSNTSEEIINKFECKSSIDFEKKLTEVTDITVDKLPIIDVVENNNYTVDIGGLSCNEKHISSTERDELDTTDLSNIILNNDIFTLADKNQSIQKIKETYNFGDESSTLMIENPVDNLGEHIFQVPSQQEVQHTSLLPSEPAKEKVDCMKLSQPIDATHSDKVLTCGNNLENWPDAQFNQQSEPSKKCGSQLHEDNDVRVMGVVDEQFNTKQEEMDINDLYHDGPDFLHNIRGREYFPDVITDTFENKKRESDNSNDISLLPELKQYNQNEKDSIIIQQKENVSVKPRKIKKSVINSKSKVKKKNCANKGSSIPSVSNTLDTIVEYCKPANIMSILNHTENNFNCNEQQVLETCQLSEQSTLKLKPIESNVMSELAKPSNTDEPIKRKTTDLSHELLGENLAAKKLKYDEKEVKHTTMCPKKVPEASTVDDFTDTGTKTVNNRKSKKEQALNKLKQILITNKDVNLNNELINMNEEEILQNSDSVNASNEKSMDIDDSNKLLIDNSKLMDEDNETIIGSQMLDNMEMFGNLSEYFNIDQNNELNQDLNNEDDDVQNTNLMCRESTTIEQVNEISSNVKSNLSNTTSKVEVKTRRKSSVKQNIVQTRNNQKHSKLILDDKKPNDQETVKQPVKRKNSTSKLLETITLDQRSINVDAKRSNESVKKPKVTKQIFFKSTSNNPTNKNLISITDDIKKENTIRITKSAVEKSVVEKSEDFTKIDTFSKSIPEAETKDTLKLITSKRKSTNSRSRSNSTDSHKSNCKKKSNLKTLLPYTSDASLELNKTSAKVVSQPHHSSSDKEDGLTQEILRLEGKVIVKPKAKMKSKPKIEPPAIQEDIVKPSKPSKSKKTKITTCQPAVNEVEGKTSNDSEVSVAPNEKCSTVKESYTDQISSVVSQHVEGKTHKDGECQTDEQVEKSQIIVINDIPITLDDTTNPKYLYRTVTEKYMLVTEPLHRIPFPETNITFSTCKILPNLSTGVHYNKQKNANELEDVASKPPISSQFSLKCIKTVETVSPKNTLSKRLEQSHSPDSMLKEIFSRKKPGSRLDNEVLYEEQPVKNLDKIPEVKKHIVNNQNISEKKVHIPDTVASICGKEIRSNKRRMKKEPKYIMMKLNGNEKVYKLIDKPIMKGILPPTVEKILEQKLPLSRDNSKRFENINERNPLDMKSNSEGNHVNSMRQIESTGSHGETYKYTSSIAKGENHNSNKNILKGSYIRNREQNQNVLYHGKSLNPSNTISRPGTSEIPKAILQRAEVQSLVDKIRIFKNDCIGSPIGSNVKVVQRTKDHIGNIESIEDRRNTTRETKDTEVISTIEIKKGVHIHLKPLALTKHVNPPEEKRIVRMVPLYANKEHAMVESKRNLDRNQRNYINLTPAKQIIPREEDLQNVGINNSMVDFRNKNVKTVFVNNRKKYEDSAQTLLDPNKLILDFLHNNKIKTIIVGCKNKEIIRRDLSEEESGRIEHELRNANLIVNEETSGTNSNRNNGINILNKPNVLKENTTRSTNENLEESSEDTVAVIEEIQENVANTLLDEIDEDEEDGADQISSIAAVRKDVKQYEIPLKRPGDSLKVPQLLVRKNVVKCSTISIQKKDVKKLAPRKNMGKKVTECKKAIEELSGLCDIVQIYRCKMCCYSSHVKNGFVQHLKSAHDRVSKY